jgi:hypothetical protein
LNDEELFLMNGFKAMISYKLVSMITDWLDEKFVVIYRADALRIDPIAPIANSLDSKEGLAYIDKVTSDAARCFGVNSNMIAYFKDSEKKEAQLYSLFENGNNKKARIPAELFESYGTIRFVNMFPLVANALVNGGILIVDEFDASIHPMALMSIINIFHNDDININHAQLIFNTHNPIFLNANLFRRDEIKFVERDENTHLSTLYSLSDFGTVGKEGVRKNEDYMKNYFIDRYGAITDIDFTPIFESLIDNEKEV